MRQFRYLLLFTPTDNEPQLEPIKLMDYSAIKSINKNTMHQLDSDLIPILDLLEYCLHLPRNELDVCDSEIEITEVLYDNPQDIFLCPFNLANYQILSSFDIIMCDEGCFKYIFEKLKKMNISKECISNKDITNMMLSKHWQYLYELRDNKSAQPVPDIEKQYLLKDEQMLFLPSLFLARQYGISEKVYYKAFNAKDAFNDSSDQLATILFRNRALLKCKGISQKELFVKTFDQAFEQERKSGQLNLVITLPGISRNQIKYAGLLDVLPNAEKRIIRIVGVHKAIAKKAVLMELPLVESEMFAKLNNVEIAFEDGKRPNNKYIHKMLNDLSRLFESSLSTTQLYALQSSKQITVFSDYPINLYMPINCDSTLQCQKEICSRMLTPLTKCLQIELPKHPFIYLGKRCRVMFIECVKDDTDANKIVRAGSLALQLGLQNNSKRCNKFTYQAFEAYSIKELKRILREHYLEFEILVLSAHGYYDRRSNISGLLVGDEIWFANDNDYFTPPIVMLSACNTSPRGNGAVSVADMFLRSHSEAVLSCFTPISSSRNAFLLNRFFT